MVKKPTLVFSFGVPRSGTTFLHQMLNNGVGFINAKIPEYTKVHTINSDTGLVDLARIFYSYNVLFVRIIRKPVEIFESVYAAKEIKATNHKEVIPSIFKGIDSVGRNTERRVFSWIDNDRKNTEAQKNKVLEKLNKVNIFTVNYNKLNKRGYVIEIATRLSSFLPYPEKNKFIFIQYVAEYYNKKPVREGALSHQIKIDLPIALKAKINKKYNG